MSNKFFMKYSWSDFENTEELTPYQKQRINNMCRKNIEAVVQKAINQSVKDRGHRRSELKAHSDPNNPFILDLGGEG